MAEQFPALPRYVSTPAMNQMKNIIAGANIPTKGYCLVFERENKYYRLRITNNKKLEVWDKTTETDQQITLKMNEAYDNKNLSLSLLSLIPRFDEIGIKYNLLYSRDDKLKYVYLIVSIDAKTAEFWAETNQMELEIDPYKTIKKGRQDSTFLLAERTYLGENGETKNIKDFTNQKHNKLSLECWEKMHIPYKKALKEIYKQEMDDSFGCINNRIYLRILYGLLVKDMELGGCGMMVQRYLMNKKHPLIAFFALHDRYRKQRVNRIDSASHVIPSRNKLKRDMNQFRELVSQDNNKIKDSDYMASKSISWKLRVDDIRSYYGEAIGFYFAWLLHYNVWLWPMAFVGSIWFLVQLIFGEIAVYGSSVVILLAICWSTATIEVWYRRECSLQYKWGMINLESSEVPRSAFDGKIFISPTNGMLIEHHKSQCAYFCRILASLSLSFICILIVVACVTAIRIAREGYGPDTIYSVLFGVINAIQIQIMNAIYTKLAFALNDFEGHRLEIHYYNNLVIKRIFFIIFNSFNSLFFIAYWDAFDSDKLRLEALRIQLVTLFVSAIVIQNSAEILVPKIISWSTVYCQQYCLRKEKQKYEKLKQEKSDRDNKSYDSMGKSNVYIKLEIEQNPDWIGVDLEDEKDAFSLGTLIDENKELCELHERYYIKTKHDRLSLNMLYSDIEHQIIKHVSPDVLDNTAEIVVLHGYIILFVIVFPVMPLLCIINNYFEIRVDFYNLITGQRPVPMASHGIGIWKLVLSSFNIFAIYNNMALWTWRTGLAKGLVGDDERYLLLMFFIITLIFLFCIFIIRDAIPDTTNKINDAILRQQQCQKHFIKFQSQIKSNNIQSKDDNGNDETYRSRVVIRRKLSAK